MDFANFEKGFGRLWMDWGDFENGFCGLWMDCGNFGWILQTLKMDFGNFGSSMGTSLGVKIHDGEMQKSGCWEHHNVTLGIMDYEFGFGIL